jgi:hypothetical protein
MLRDATVPGAGTLRKRQKIELSVAQAQYLVGRGYADYVDGTVYLEPDTVQMVDKPIPLKLDRTLFLNRETQETAPPLEPVGEPEDPDAESEVSHKRKKSKEG